MKKHLLLYLLLPLISFAQIPTGYYNGTSGLSGYALKSKLHEIVSQKHYAYNYSNVTGFYATTDIDNYYENDGSILDIYSENPTGADSYNYTPTQITGTASAEGQGFNREHGMPQSTYYSVYPMYSDLHYLIPTDAYINQRRSNYPYARNNGNNRVFLNGSKIGNSTTPGYSNLVYEPLDAFKGDVARYLLYFVTRYEGSLKSFNYQVSTSPLDGSEEKGYADWYITMLKEWNTLDPVSQKEIDRNNAVFAIEKTRNPFIDHPEWVNAIWSVTADNIPPQAPQNLMDNGVGASFIKLSWQPNTDTDLLGYQIFQDGKYIGYTKTTSFVADRLSPSTAYNFTVKAYDNAFLQSVDSNTVTITTLASDGFAKELMISKYIEGTTNFGTNQFNNAIEIINKTGHEVLLNNYHLSTQLKNTLTNTYYFSESYMLEGVIAENERIVIVNPFASFTSYNVPEANYVTSSPPLSYTGTQYVELAYATKYLKTVSTNNHDIFYTTVDALGFKGVDNTLTNQSLYRNIDVVNPNSNFTLSEWTAYPMDYIVDLGTDSVLNVEENNLENEFVIYPNPVDNQLFLKGKNLDKVKNAKIYEASGKLLFSENAPFKNKNYLNISKLNVGVYYLQIDKKTLKFIKK